MSLQLDAGARSALLLLARMSVERIVGMASMQVVHEHPAFDRRAGAFVTLHVSRSLRGCIGHPDAVRRLGDVVAHCAAAAAREDPRFEPLRMEDMTALSIEISVLSRLEPLADPESLVIGRHGLAVEREGRRGLLLPQVAASRGWSAFEFLEHTCTKAGLPPDAWRRGAVIHVFEADVFADEPDAVSLRATP
jgi:AmmeMemoRadiSam system protein A